MTTKKRIDTIIAEIKEKYKDNPNDKNYFLCKLAMKEGLKKGLNFKYIMGHVNVKELEAEGHKLKLQDVTDRAINHAKEQSWINRT